MHGTFFSFGIVSWLSFLTSVLFHRFELHLRPWWYIFWTVNTLHCRHFYNQFSHFIGAKFVTQCHTQCSSSPETFVRLASLYNVMFLSNSLILLSRCPISCFRLCISLVCVYWNWHSSFIFGRCGRGACLLPQYGKISKIGVFYMKIWSTFTDISRKFKCII